MAAFKEILAKTAGSSLDLGQTVIFFIKKYFALIVAARQDRTTGVHGL